ncbi:MAG TPA: single-stranded DNA-binding protein [Amycolatopsis sp.]|nr:single-stranded DNA-binding protein [Amycolatopsis sp.]
MTSPEITVTASGNLTADPVLRFTDAGVPVASFTIAHTPRIRRGDEWVDGEAVFLPAEVWREQAENVAESLRRGHRVTAVGALRQDNWKDKETGEPRSRLKLVVSEIGASTRYARVSVSKTGKGGADRDVPPPVDPATGEAATERTAPAVA